METQIEKKKWAAALGNVIGATLLQMLTPYLEEPFGEVVGSLRRKKAEVGDVEILYVPKFGEIRKPGEMFGSHGNLADNYINGLLGVKLEKRPNVNGGFTWGNQNKLALHKATGMPVDLFATTKENWFVALVIRTGPKDFNIRLIEAAKRRGRQLHAYGAFTEIATGETLWPTSEREVFAMAGMDWLEPEERK